MCAVNVFFWLLRVIKYIPLSTYTVGTAWAHGLGYEWILLKRTVLPPLDHLFWIFLRGNYNDSNQYKRPTGAPGVTSAWGILVVR